MRDREAQAEAFHALHAEGQFLILANAWDAGSARLIESLGASAIATTSSGVSWARGHADGHALPIPTAWAPARAPLCCARRGPRRLLC